MSPFSRVAVAVFFMLFARAAWCDLLFPSVPAGGKLHATFAISPPLPGIDITLEVDGTCGSFNGATSIVVVTDASGAASFDFNAGSSTAKCVIRGSHDAYQALGQVAVYRPQDVIVDRLFSSSAGRVVINSPVDITAMIKAGGIPLYGVPATIDPLPSAGASGSLTTSASATTDQNGYVHFALKTNGTPGIFDAQVRAFDAAGRWRFIVVPSLPDFSQPVGGQAYNVYDPDGPLLAKVSLATSAYACRLDSVRYIPNDPGNDALPPDVLDFPQGRLEVTTSGCGSQVMAYITYPKPLPSDGRCVFSGKASSTTPSWVNMPCSILGDYFIVALAAKGPADISDGTTDRITFSGGVARPGTRPPQRPIPSVQDMWWAGSAESGWGMSVVQPPGSRVMFNVIYAYDAAGNPTWWVQSSGLWDTAFHYDFTGSVYSPYGTPWYAFDPAVEWVGSAVGALTLSFEDDSHATADMVINGVHMAKSIVRQPFGRGDTAPAGNVGGMWYGGASQSGWGVAVLQQQGTLFSVWFTYDESNSPTWFVMPGGQWTSGTTYEGRIYRTHATAWLGQSFDASKVQASDVGSYRLTFPGVGKATFDYSIGATHGSLALERQL